MTAPTVIALPPSGVTRPHGWTVYRHGAVIGWVRHGADCEPPRPGYWVIPRHGHGDPRSYRTPRDAGLALGARMT